MGQVLDAPRLPAELADPSYLVALELARPKAPPQDGRHAQVILYDHCRGYYFLLGLLLAEARGYYSDPHLFAQRLVDDSAEDDVGVLMGLLVYEARRLVNVVDGPVRGAADVGEYGPPAAY